MVDHSLPRILVTSTNITSGLVSLMAARRSMAYNTYLRRERSCLSAVRGIDVDESNSQSCIETLHERRSGMKFSSLFVQISMYMYMSNLKKVRMDYSCHGRYKGIHIIFSMFSLLSS